MSNNQNKGKNYEKKSYIVALIMLVIAVVGLLFGDGFYWRISDLFENKGTENEDLISEEETKQNEQDVSASSNENYSPSEVSHGFVSFDNQCEVEHHEKVKNFQELNGFIFWDGTENSGYTYYSMENQGTMPAENVEPLHHIIFDFTGFDYKGMGINIIIDGQTGVAAKDFLENDKFEFYISEGEYVVKIEKWNEDKTASVTYDTIDLVVDHCGTYVLK